MLIITDIKYYFELLVFIITIGFFLIASYQDLKDRLVDGYIWLYLFLIAIPVLLVRLILYWNSFNIILYMVISIGLGFLIAFAMLFLGLWGGADIIALICLSLLSPIALPLLSGFPSVTEPNFLELFLPMSLSLVMNAALIQIPLPIIILGKNYLNYKKNPEAYQLPQASSIQKFFASFLGEPLLVSSILSKPIFHYQSLEKNTLFDSDNDLNSIYPVPFIRLTSEPLLRWKLFHNKNYSLPYRNTVIGNQRSTTLISNSKQDVNWKFDFSVGLKSEEEDMYRQRIILRHASEGSLKRKYLWVQYSVPFLIPMLLGYILSFYGINILFEILKVLYRI